MTGHAEQASQAQATQPSGAAQQFGDFAPGLVAFTGGTATQGPS